MKFGAFFRATGLCGGSQGYEKREEEAQQSGKGVCVFNIGNIQFYVQTRYTRGMGIGYDTKVWFKFRTDGLSGRKC
jgi:hypothetical protein